MGRRVWWIRTAPSEGARPVRIRAAPLPHLPCVGWDLWPSKSGGHCKFFSDRCTAYVPCMSLVEWRSCSTSMVLFRSIWGLTVLSGWVRDGAECEGYARFPDKEEDTIRLRVRQLWGGFDSQNHDSRRRSIMVVREFHKLCLVWVQVPPSLLKREAPWASSQGASTFSMALPN